MPSVTFDCVGTLFSYEAGANAIGKRIGPKLAKYGISPKVAFYTFVTSTERDYAYLSTIGKYQQFHHILLHTIKRTLFQVGVPADEIDTIISDDDIAYIRSEYMKLQARPGAAELIQMLRDNGISVWACSDASMERVTGYFAEAGIEMPRENILSADSCSAGKPQPEVYQKALENVKDEGKAIFAAAHAWDCAAAQAWGFTPAYCTIYEYDPCEAVFGKFDICEPDLISMGKAIVAKYGVKK